MPKKAVSPEITIVLDKIEAYYELQKKHYYEPDKNGKRQNNRRSALTDLAHFLNKPYERPYEWVIIRRASPRAETFFLMQSWIRSRISLLGRKERKRYNELLGLVIKQNNRRSK